MMVNWLYEQQMRKHYASGMDPFEGVVLKMSRGHFTCCPPQMAAIPDSLYQMVMQMNVRCAMTINTPVVRTILDSIRARSQEMDYVPLPDGLRVQILSTMADLPRGQLHHFSAFIEDVKMLVVWDDEPEKLLPRAQALETKFMEIIWGGGENADDDEDSSEEKKGGGGNVTTEEVDPDSLEGGETKERRPVMLQSACIVAITLALCLTCLGLGFRAVAYESTVDRTYVRLALLVVTPAQFFVSLVSCPAVS